MAFRSEDFNKESANFQNKALALPLTDDQKEKITTASAGLMDYYKGLGLNPIEAFMATNLFLEYLKTEYGFRAIAAIGTDG